MNRPGGRCCSDAPCAVRAAVVIAAARPGEGGRVPPVLSAPRDRPRLAGAASPTRAFSVQRLRDIRRYGAVRALRRSRETRGTSQ
jgi:hypothetical protein